MSSGEKRRSSSESGVKVGIVDLVQVRTIWTQGADLVEMNKQVLSILWASPPFRCNKRTKVVVVYRRCTISATGEVVDTQNAWVLLMKDYTATVALPSILNDLLLSYRFIDRDEKGCNSSCSVLCS